MTQYISVISAQQPLRKMRLLITSIKLTESPDMKSADLLEEKKGITIQREILIFSLSDISGLDQHSHPHQDEDIKDCPDVAVVTTFDTVLRNSCSIVYKKNCSVQSLAVHDEETSSGNYKTKCQGRDGGQLENILFISQICFNLIPLIILKSSLPNPSP